MCVCVCGVCVCGVCVCVLCVCGVCVWETIHVVVVQSIVPPLDIQSHIRNALHTHNSTKSCIEDH